MIIHTDAEPVRAFRQKFLWWPVRAVDTHTGRPCWAWLEFGNVFPDRVEVSSFWC